MGLSMARNLMRAGYGLTVHNRTEHRARPLLDEGASWAPTPSDAAAGSDAVITIVGFPRDVESVYLGEEGILKGAVAGTLLIDMTTSSPLLAKRLYDEARARGMSMLDAPVSGGDRGAREGTLSIMAGGDEEAFGAALPLFRAMGGNVVLQGGAGAGQHTKMANQITIASGMIGVCEALAYAERAGLDPFRVLDSIAGGAAGSWSLSNYGPRILKGDFQPGFYIKHFVKDMELAAQSAREMALDAPGLDLALRLYRELLDKGWGEEGTQALFRLFREDLRP
ncbi:NAD(P)-dependent oxidoreductase [Aminithiophilus ramosus]|uniref:NAD(P)-dependent oxidoreductase n=3 Tax=Synergistia TaxID=649775 RepID=A0A9Q7F1B1_9BACT|nr:NAD(P)-dependent oxidoreductase [Aminithiophilus ramosus]QVL37637.1 NAD(P)-dependent oxidoreductase [Synergistota bacterium]